LGHVMQKEKRKKEKEREGKKKDWRVMRQVGL
jgi:hypothetical protein